MRKFLFNLGQVVEFSGIELSTVIGIDNYKLWSLENTIHSWTSYTMRIASENASKRWWFVELPIVGTFLFRSTDEAFTEQKLNRDLSGYVQLQSEGNADLSGDSGALNMFFGDNQTVFAEEVFPGLAPIRFEGRRLII